MLESKIEKTVSEYARSKGFLSFKFTSPSHAGVCDRMFISSTGKVWFIEFKREGGKPTPLQVRHHQTLVERGVTVYVVDSIALGKEVVDYESQPWLQGHHRAAVRYTGGSGVTT